MRLGGHERFGASGVARLLARLQVTTDSHSLPLTLRWGFVSGISHASRRRGDLCLNILNTSPLKTIVTPDRGKAHLRSKFEVCLLDTMLEFKSVFEDMRCANLQVTDFVSRRKSPPTGGDFRRQTKSVTCSLALIS